MSQINVTRNSKDQFYRYKMPPLLSKIEGRGNGIKTVIANMLEISKSLKTQPDYATKFLGMKVGAQVIIDQKNQRYIINGQHDQKKLQNLMFTYIERYILCSLCGNPETKMRVNDKKTSIALVCAACGKLTMLSQQSVLYSYIMAHPPPAEKISSIIGESNTEIINSDPVFCDNIQIDNQWNLDVNSHMMKIRQKNANACISEEFLEKNNIEDRVNTFITFIKSKINIQESNYCEDIKNESKRLNIGDKAVLIISSCIFESDDPVNDLKNNSKLISLFCQSKCDQIMFLHSLEVLIVDGKLIIEKLAKLFIVSYELELVEEDAFLEWSKKKNNKYVRNHELLDKIHASVLKFIDWLKTAEEESDDEDEEDNDDKEEEKETEEKKDIPSTQLISVEENGKMNGHHESSIRQIEDDLDDLNIDDI